MKLFYLFFVPILALVLPLQAVTAEEGQEVEPAVILGGGVGALSSAIYLGRAGHSPLVIAGDTPGGLLTQSTSVQNWPGELEIDGTTLTDRIRKQASANGARFLDEEVIRVDFSKRPFIITTRSLTGTNAVRETRAQTCIVAMGTTPNFLSIPGEETYWGQGVSNCAVCDGSLYRDKNVAIVGGGDAAVLEALYLSEIAKEVSVFVRKGKFRAIEEKRREALLSRPNVKVYYNTVVEAVKGDRRGLTHIIVKKGKEDPVNFPIDGLFLAIGSTPNSSIFKGALKLDKNGYIKLGKDQETSVPGVYAIGDIVDPVYKQAISAAGDGAKAALQAQKYISENPTLRLAAKGKKEESSSSKGFAGEVIEVSSLEEFYNEINTSDVPVVVDFYASWCGPCKRLSPLLVTSANQMGGRAKFLKVNVDKLGALSSSFDIRSMPTVLVFDSSGKVLERKIGTDQITDLLKKLESSEPTSRKRTL